MTGRRTKRRARRGSQYFQVWAPVLLALSGCTSAPLDYPKTPTSVLADTTGTSLSAASKHWRRESPDGNGFYPLEKGLDAFGGRLVLIDRAEKSIDAQYFLMKPDSAGLVFSDQLLKAADRGVRVRFLLDDIFTTVDDRWLVLLNEHPNIEMRLFNPIARKGIYAFNYLAHFGLANRRMHNKSFIVDNQAAIVGGRNIAEEYFQLDTAGEFIDFDMLVAGPIVREVSAEFDLYWNHELAIPMDAFYEEASPEAMLDLRRQIDARMTEAQQSVYGRAVDTNLIHALNDGTVRPYIADARLIVDDPQKLLQAISDETKIVATEMRKVLMAATEEIVVFTPYFIPGKLGMQTIREITGKGVRLVLVTNSLATNNHTSVHSAYSSYRKPLLDADVELWEARVDAAKTTSADGTTELGHLTLHTKGILIDRSRVFVGSLNLDPRSIDINTEMGILIDSGDLAARLTEHSLSRIPDMAWRVEYDDDGRIRWRATIAGREVIETREPQTSAWKRFQAWLLKIAPERQL